MEHIDYNFEDRCMNDEPLFLDELFKDKYDHSGEKICVKNLKSRDPFEKRKLYLSTSLLKSQLMINLLKTKFKNL